MAILIAIITELIPLPPYVACRYSYGLRPETFEASCVRSKTRTRRGRFEQTGLVVRLIILYLKFVFFLVGYLLRMSLLFRFALQGMHTRKQQAQVSVFSTDDCRIVPGQNGRFFS